MKCVIIGHSHIDALIHASWQADSIVNRQNKVEYKFIRLPIKELASVKTAGDRWIASDVVREYLAENSAFEDREAIFISILGGNEYNLLGLLEQPLPFDFDDRSVISDYVHIPANTIYETLNSLMLHQLGLLEYIKSSVTGAVAHLQTPPPIEASDLIQSRLTLEGFAAEMRVSPAAFRMKLWRTSAKAARNICARTGVDYLDPELRDPLTDFMLPEHIGSDATHANAAYGEACLRKIYDIALNGSIESRGSYNPYRHIPSYQRWSQGVSNVPSNEIDPVVTAPFRISRDDKIATVGSCFAQHISSRLQTAGFNYFVAEAAHYVIPKEVAKLNNYGVFSCRFGNVYTSGQLLQLFLRAYGQFTPSESFWEQGASIVDPFRPAIQYGGFKNLEDLNADLVHHFACLRNMFENSNVLVYTMGLTECWVRKDDGAVLPVCPGVIAGTFNDKKYAFRNEHYEDVVSNMQHFLDLLRRINPTIKIILTVSPVSLAATAEERHVITSTVLSKSILRAAADKLTSTNDNVVYFPSYEIITGPQSHGRYFSDDLRNVKPEGVDHVMRLFFKHFTETDDAIAPLASAPLEGAEANIVARIAAAVCEEAMLDAGS